MSKKNAVFGLLSIVKKGKELYNDYGETAISLAKSLKGQQKQNVETSSGVVNVDKKEETELPVVAQTVGNEVQIVKTPTDLKAYRQEVEKDDSFHDNLSKLEASVKFVGTGKMTPQDVVGALESLSDVVTDTLRYSEEQETKREEIRAMRDFAIAKVNAVRDVMQTYLDKTFDERATLFAEQFKCLDMALKNGDNDQLSMVLTSINTLAASSPFKNLSDINEVQKALTNSDTEWDI